LKTSNALLSASLYSIVKHVYTCKLAHEDPENLVGVLKKINTKNTKQNKTKQTNRMEKNDVYHIFSGLAYLVNPTMRKIS